MGRGDPARVAAGVGGAGLPRADHLAPVALGADDLDRLTEHQLAADPAVQADPAVRVGVEPGQPRQHVGVRGHRGRVQPSR